MHQFDEWVESLARSLYSRADGIGARGGQDPRSHPLHQYRKCLVGRLRSRRRIDARCDGPAGREADVRPNAAWCAISALASALETFSKTSGSPKPHLPIRIQSPGE